MFFKPIWNEKVLYLWASNSFKNISFILLIFENLREKRNPYNELFLHGEKEIRLFLELIENSELISWAPYLIIWIFRDVTICEMVHEMHSTLSAVELKKYIYANSLSFSKKPKQIWPRAWPWMEFETLIFLKK